MIKEKVFWPFLFCILAAGALCACSNTEEGLPSTKEASAEGASIIETGSGKETESSSEIVSVFEIESIEGLESTSESETISETETTSEPEPPETEPPIQTGTLSYGLSRPEFLQIFYGGSEKGYDTQVPYHGGNQSWFYNSQTGEGDLTLEQEGCGLIAVADTMLYLSLYHADMETMTAPFVFNKEEPLDYHVYADYILHLRSRNDLFPFSAQFGGVLGTELAKGVRQYAKEQGYSMHVKWGGRSEEAQTYVNETSARTMLSAFLESEEIEERIERFQRKTNTILDMLQKDIPVVMAVGPFSEINLYEVPEDGNLEGQLELAQTVGAHYFIITSVTVNFDMMRIMMQIETWGQTYVIDYLEFTEATYQGMAYLSDILYIKP